MAKSDPREYNDVEIAASGSLSGAAKLGGAGLIGIIIPTGTGAFATNTDRLYFYGSVDDTTYVLIRDNDGSAVAVTIAVNNTNGATHLDPDKFRAWSSVKVGTHRNDTGAAVAQSAKKTFTLISE